MSTTELKMQPTIHWEGKAGYLPRPIHFRFQMYCELHF
jgi:hypothetical protein